MIVSLINIFIVSYSRYSIEKIYNTELLGIYASIAAPAVVVQTVPALVFYPFVNIFASCLKEKNMVKFTKVFSMCCAFIFVFTLICFWGANILGEWGLTLLFGNSIKPYAYLLPGAILCGGLTVFILYMNIVFSVCRDIIGSLIGNSIGLIICLFTTNTLLVKYNLLGANYVLIISQGVTVIYLFIRFFSSYKAKFS